MRKLNSKVRITGSPRTDGSVDSGKIIGIKYEPDAYYVGLTATQFLEQFKVPSYLVASVNAVTNRGNCTWYAEKDLSDFKPKA